MGRPGNEKRAVRIFFAILLVVLCLLSGCGSTTAFLHTANLQAVVDSIDAVRERNEAAQYRLAMGHMQHLVSEADRSMRFVEAQTGYPSPRCELEVPEDAFPMTFALVGIDYGRYIRSCNVIVYPLGDHDTLRHEMTHSITLNMKPLPELCNHEIIAEAVATYGMFKDRQAEMDLRELGRMPARNKKRPKP